jgi:hypothetical protein
MSDNLSQKRPQDASRVSLSESWEIEYWTREFNCSREELEDAVQTVGNSADAVRRYLNK